MSEILKIPVTGGEVCILAKGTIIEGDIKVDSHLRLEGDILGKLSCNGRLVMSAQAIIQGPVQCKELDCEGRILGKIQAKESIVLKSTAVVDGDIECSSLQIDLGATYNGQCTMNKRVG
jgi:cytoskeletal protein CcmA (bactofilin family)